MRAYNNTYTVHSNYKSCETEKGSERSQTETVAQLPYYGVDRLEGGFHFDFFVFQLTVERMHHVPVKRKVPRVIRLLQQNHAITVGNLSLVVFNPDSVHSCKV